MSLIINRLRHKYDNFELMIEDLHLDSGEIIGLIGRNGSGKTTFQKALAQQINADSIDVSWKNIRSYKKDLAYIPDHIEFKNISINEYINVYRHFYKLDEDKLSILLKYYNINIHENLRDLDLGEAQVINLVIVQARSASLYLFDEPSDGLDSLTLKKMIRGLYDISNDESLILISTHQVKAYQNILDRIIYIEDGKILFNYSTIEIEESGLKILEYLYTDPNLIQEYILEPSLAKFIACVEMRKQV